MDVPGCSVKALCNAGALRDVDGTLLELERGLRPGSREFFEHVRHDFWIRTASEVTSQGELEDGLDVLARPIACRDEPEQQPGESCSSAAVS
jgi:hypothetical protein